MFRLPHDRSVVASNLTSDEETGLGRWTTDQIVQVIRTMRHPRGMPIEGPMANYGEAWSRLTDSDAQALAVYVKSIPPIRREIPARYPTVTTR